MNLQENIHRIKEVMGIIAEESIIPISIRRRANEETLKQYITMGEINYPTLCDDFNDEYEYSDHVIDYAVDEFLSEYTPDNEDYYYSDVMDYIRSLCRDIFGEYLYEIYLTTCEEYLNETAQKNDTAKWVTCKNCDKKFTQTIHKGKKSLPICPTCGTHNKDKKEEQTEVELNERCWTGYTQKGMKTMFGKRYPNCVKIKKKK